MNNRHCFLGQMHSHILSCQLPTSLSAILVASQSIYLDGIYLDGIYLDGIYLDGISLDGIYLPRRHIPDGVHQPLFAHTVLV